MRDLNKIALDFYLDYKNNYLTAETMAEDYAISEDLANALIMEGMGIQKAINESKELDKL